MAVSSTEICARAMVLLGQAPIIDIDDVSVPNAVKCKAVYVGSRDALLREYAWGFATKRFVLSADPVAPAFGYTYQFLLPPDCLRVLGTDDAALAYELEGGYLLCDSSAVSIRYTARIEETGKFDSLFDECLSIRIARELAYSVLKKASMVQAMDGLYKLAAPKARLIDSIETRRNEVDDAPTSSWIKARG